MSPVLAVLTDLAGPFEWGVRDCPRLAAAVCRAYGGAPVVPPLALASTEARGIARAVAEFGSVEACYRRYLLASGAVEVTGFAPGRLMIARAPVVYRSAGIVHAVPVILVAGDDGAWHGCAKEGILPAYSWAGEGGVFTFEGR